MVRATAIVAGLSFFVALTVGASARALTPRVAPQKPAKTRVTQAHEPDRVILKFHEEPVCGCEPDASSVDPP